MAPCFAALPLLSESEDISSLFSEEVIASSSLYGFIIIGIAAAFFITSIVCFSIYGSKKRRLKKEEEAKEKELREQRRKEEDEFFQGIMDRYGPRIEEAAKAVIEMHKNDAPTMFYKCHIGYDFKKVPSVLTIFLDFYFGPRDWAYANSGMAKILV